MVIPPRKPKAKEVRNLLVEQAVHLAEQLVGPAQPSLVESEGLMVIHGIPEPLVEQVILVVVQVPGETVRPEQAEVVQTTQNHP